MAFGYEPFGRKNVERLSHGTIGHPKPASPGILNNFRAWRDPPCQNFLPKVSTQILLNQKCQWSTFVGKISVKLCGATIIIQSEPCSALYLFIGMFSSPSE
jgi:hypothetical protein